MAAFEDLKEANPSGRFWIKLGAADPKEALMECMKGLWNGNQDVVMEITRVAMGV